MQRDRTFEKHDLVDRCLATFVEAGTLDLSLDQLANKVGLSKRMLVHYFGRREIIEQEAMTRLEEQLRKQFAPESFPRGVALKHVVLSLWDQTTAPDRRGVLLLVMDVCRRAWSGSARAKAFYQEQQRLWVKLLMRFLPDRLMVEELLQVFQGAAVAYLITGDRKAGRRGLMRSLAGEHKAPKGVISRRR